MSAESLKTKVDGFDFSLYLAAVVSFMSQHFRPFRTQHSWQKQPEEALDGLIPGPLLASAGLRFRISNGN